MTERANLWEVTINNPTDSDRECLSLAMQKGWKVIGQKEVGENGTPHWQMAIRTPQVRFSAVKKMFPRGHISVARSAPALLKYVTKEQTRAGDLPEQQDKYPSLSKFWDLVFQYLNGLDKDGLDYVALAEGKVRFYREERDRLYRKAPLTMLDEAMRSLIVRGYHVEGIGCNPNTRSQWKICGDAILLRSYEAVKNVTIQTQQDAYDNTTPEWQGEARELPLSSGNVQDAQDSETSSVQTCSSSS